MGEHERERIHWVLLSMVAGIGPIRFQHLLQVCRGAEAAWHATDLQLAAAGLDRRGIHSLRTLRSTTTPESAARRLADLRITPLTLEDDGYPAKLRQIADPPPVLFVRGSLPKEPQIAVALVGTRRATPYGRAVAERLGRELAEVGVTIVSGLARGVDTAAHRAAVQANGRTWAVLANGLDQVYPPENTDLAQQIVSKHGALISEFAPGVPPDAVNFPRRNRIIAGLSDATLIVEAGERSGALITADFALEQGRDVLAVPGSILSPVSAGANELLKQGATPVTGVDDVLRALGIVTGQSTFESRLARRVPELPAHERCVWEALDSDPRHVDELVRALGRGAGEISGTLAMLELKGLACNVGAMLYTRA